MNLIKLTTFSLLFAASSAAFGGDTVSSGSQISVAKNCATWALRGSMRSKGVTVTLTDNLDVCFGSSNKDIYLFSSPATGVTSRNSKQVTAIVAFAAARRGESCEDKLTPKNYRDKFSVRANANYEKDIVARGSGTRYANIQEVCARLYVNR